MSFRGAKRTRNPEVRDSGSAPRGTSRNDAYKSHRALERVGEVGLLPREPALIVRGAAEVTVGRGPRVDRLVEIEMLADAARRQIHRLGHSLLKLVLRHLSGVVGIDVDRQRPRHADGVSELQRAAIGKAG